MANPKADGDTGHDAGEKFRCACSHIIDGRACTCRYEVEEQGAICAICRDGVHFITGTFY